MEDVTTNLEEATINLEDVTKNLEELTANLGEVIANLEEVKASQAEVTANQAEVTANLEEVTAMMEEVNLNLADVTVNPELVQQVLGFEMLLENILSKLILEDLLTCSIINRQWNHIARKIIRKQENCRFSIVSFIWLRPGYDLRSPCEDLKEVDTLIQNAFNSPFNGVKVDVSEGGYYVREHNCMAADIENLEEFYPAIWNLDLKHLKFNCNQPKCPASKIILRRLFQKSTSIEHLEIKTLPKNYMVDAASGMDSDDPELLKLPNLKSIECNDDDLLAQIINIAPARPLEIRSPICFRHLEAFPNSNLTGVKQFFFLPNDIVYPKLPTRDIIRDFVMQQPKLKTLSITFFATENYQVFYDFVMGLLLPSVDTLTAMYIDLLSLMYLSMVGAPPCSKIQRLFIGYMARYDEGGRLPLLKMDLLKMFPKLEHIILNPVWLDEEMKIVNEFDNFPSRENATVGWDCIKQVEVSTMFQGKLSPWLRQVFPNAEINSFR